MTVGEAGVLTVIGMTGKSTRVGSPLKGSRERARRVHDRQHIRLHLAFDRGAIAERVDVRGRWFGTRRPCECRCRSQDPPLMQAPSVGARPIADTTRSARQAFRRRRNMQSVIRRPDFSTRRHRCGRDASGCRAGRTRSRRSRLPLRAADARAACLRGIDQRHRVSGEREVVRELAADQPRTEDRDRTRRLQALPEARVIVEVVDG